MALELAQVPNDRNRGLREVREGLQPGETLDFP